MSIQNENRTVIAGTVSDSTGQYKLAIQPGKNYFVACSHLAFQSASVPVTASRDTTLNFALVTATNRIDPVVVTAKFIDYKAGKYTVGIAGNPIAENRSTQELLGLLPGVTSHDSEYKINGQPVSIIYIGESGRITPSVFLFPLSTKALTYITTLPEVSVTKQPIHGEMKYTTTRITVSMLRKRSGHIIKRSEIT